MEKEKRSLTPVAKPGCTNTSQRSLWADWLQLLNHGPWVKSELRLRIALSIARVSQPCAQQKPREDQCVAKSDKTKLERSGNRLERTIEYEQLRNPVSRGKADRQP